MKISEVRVKLIESNNKRLLAFCTITIDEEFVIRDIKIIEGGNGYFVAMPSRKMTDHCKKCSGKNHLRARYCNNCGAPLNENRAPKNGKGRMKLHADIAHPINARCRLHIQKRVIDAFEKELKRSQQPGYTAPQMNVSDDDVENELT